MLPHLSAGSSLVTIFLAFIEGFALIISPCILPVLPIILSGSLSGSKKRPFGIIIGFVFTFSLFTFFSRQLVQYTGIDLTLVRYFSYIILIMLGVIMISTYLTEKFTHAMRRLANVGSTFTIANNTQGGLMSGILFGSLVGLIWTPCAGPILAAVIVQTALQQTTSTSFIILLSFGAGAAIPMLVIALFGRKIMDRVGFFKAHAIALRKTLGVIIIAAVVYMIYGADISFAVSKIPHQTQNTLIDGVHFPYQAPALAVTTEWINSPPLQLSQLKGKVVLIDFWTYSCINCIRTIPYLNDWYKKYNQYGFEIIGVHTPEFEFEKQLANVKNAIIKDEIHYPVVLDSQYVTWKNFKNSYWPAHYLIDKNGNVVYEHFGEGDYDVTESNIRFLLGIKEGALSNNESNQLNSQQTPETYLGYARADNNKSPEAISENHAIKYSFPLELALDQWALQGIWKIESDKIVSEQAGAIIKIHFNAKKVYVVMGSENGFSIDVKVLLNGEPLISGKGSDVVNGHIEVNKHNLFNVMELKQESDGILQLIPSSVGLELYTFTFGD